MRRILIGLLIAILLATDVAGWLCLGELECLKRSTLAEVANLHVEADSAHQKIANLQEQVDSAWAVIGSSQPYTSGYNPDNK